MKWLTCAIVCVCLFYLSDAFSGVLYSDAELKAAGAEWSKVEARWKKVEAHYEAKIKYIKGRKDLSPARKSKIIAREKAVLRRKSMALAVKRNEIQEMLINETNARVKGTHATSQPVKQTAGTRLGDKGHRGMKGDLDAGSGALTTEKMKDVVKEMGLDVKIRETPGTLEFEGAFEFTVNKTGIAAKPGSAFHQVKINVDAHNKETYVSESMKKRGADGKLIRQQAGADYVTVQDHKTKAMKGLLSDGDALVKHPDAMQGMAKGTSKTLGDAKIDDDTLAKILRQRGINKTPEEFRKYLQNIKEQKTVISDAAEAKRIRDVSEDVFNAAENKTRVKAKAEMADLKNRIKKARAEGRTDDVRKMSDEYVDSRVKIEETRLANEEKMREAHHGGSKKPTHPELVVEPDGRNLTRPNAEVNGRKPTIPDDALPGKVRVGAPDVPNVKTTWKTRVVKTRAVVNKVLPIVTTVVDIGQASQTLEDYVAGKIDTRQAAIRLAEQSPIGGLITAGKKINQSSADWWEATRLTAQANRQNRVNYYQQWYIRLVKAGVAKDEVRNLVADAMITGDDSGLDSQALSLKMDGKGIDRPELIVDVVVADDNVFERFLNTGKGIVIGSYEGVKYIVTAPYRVVQAWGQGEVAEADLKLQSATQIALQKTRMYRLLRVAGISNKYALIAVNDYYDDGDKKMLNKALALVKKYPHMLRKWRAESRRLLGARARLKDWYCTNRPVISSKVSVPKVVKAIK